MSSNSLLTPRLKSALLWGAIGLLVFLALHQGYLLAGGGFIGIGPVAVVAVVVFAAATLGSYYTEGNLEEFEEPEPEETDIDEWVWGGEDRADEADSEGG